MLSHSLNSLVFEPFLGVLVLTKKTVYISGATEEQDTYVLLNLGPFPAKELILRLVIGSGPCFSERNENQDKFNP